MKVLFDHNLSPRLARSLNELIWDSEIYALRDKFPTNATDLEWITTLSSEGGWIIISGDRNITKNKAEQAAFRSSRIVGFFLSKGLYKATVMKQAQRLIAVWPTIENATKTLSPGSMLEIQMSGSKLQQIR